MLLPDQDVLNALYGKDIKTVPDQLYNFDARKGQTYETISFGEWTLDWVIKHTVILHYCGRHKPWLVDKNTGRYTALYKNYFQMTQRALKQVASVKLLRRLLPCSRISDFPHFNIDERPIAG